MSQEEMDACRELIRENIGYSSLVFEFPYDAGQLDEMVELMVAAVCSKRETIRMSGNDYPPGGGEGPTAEAEPGAYPLRVRLTAREHHPGPWDAGLCPFWTAWTAKVTPICCTFAP